MTRVPTAQLTVDGQALTLPEAGLVALSVSIGCAPAVDRALLAVGWQSPIATVTPGASVELSLGYDGEHDLVLTGDVARTVGAPWGIRIDVFAEPARLQRLRVGQSYLDQSPADIIGALAQAASVRTGDLASSDSLAAYHVDERRTGWRHVNDLALLIGAEITCEPDGSLSMKSIGGGALGGLAAVATAVTDLLGGAGGYRYGGELIDVVVGASVPSPTPNVVPHGAASPLGGDKWQLLLREPDGGAPSAATIVPAAIRDQGGADVMRSGLESLGQRRSHIARVSVRGVPAVRVGEPVTIGDWPHGDVPSFRVTAIEHRIGREDGFTSHIDLEQAA